MKAITEALDEWVSEHYSYNQKLWGYCELMTRKDQVMPVSIPARQQVALDDKFELITWQRVTGTVTLGDNVQGNDWSFGLQQGIVQSATLRLVLAHKVSIGEDFIYEVIKALPTKLTVDGYQIVSIDKPASSFDTDHEQVYTTELGATLYERHRFDWNVYALNLNVEFIPCELVSPD